MHRLGAKHEYTREPRVVQPSGAMFRLHCCNPRTAIVAFCASYPHKQAYTIKLSPRSATIWPDLLPHLLIFCSAPPPLPAVCVQIVQVTLGLAAHCCDLRFAQL